VHGHCLVGYSNDIQPRKSPAPTIYKCPPRDHRERPKLQFCMGARMAKYRRNSNQNEIKFCSNSRTSNSTCSNITGAGRHRLFALGGSAHFAFKKCMEEITCGNGTGTGTGRAQELCLQEWDESRRKTWEWDHESIPMQNSNPD